MGRSTTFFDPGKILEWTEQGLLKVFQYAEKRTQRYLLHVYKKDKRRMETRAWKKQQRKQHRQLAKLQDTRLKEREQQKIVGRLQQLNDNEQENSQENSEENEQER